MPTYTFFGHDGRKAVPSFEIEVFASLSAAQDHARKILRGNPHYTVVEITTADGAEVSWVRREGDMPGVIASRQPRPQSGLHT
jgi:hypothetical protein